MDAPKYATGAGRCVLALGTGAGGMGAGGMGGVASSTGGVVYAVPAWRYNPTPRLCHPGCRHCTPRDAA